MFCSDNRHTLLWARCELVSCYWFMDVLGELGIRNFNSICMLVQRRPNNDLNMTVSRILFHILPLLFRCHHGHCYMKNYSVSLDSSIGCEKMSYWCLDGKTFWIGIIAQAENICIFLFLEISIKAYKPLAWEPPGYVGQRHILACLIRNCSIMYYEIWEVFLQYHCMIFVLPMKLLCCTQ